MGGGSRVHEFFLFYVGPITIVVQESIFAFCICGALSPREFDSLLEMPLEWFMWWPFNSFVNYHSAEFIALNVTTLHGIDHEYLASAA